MNSILAELHSIETFYSFYAKRVSAVYKNIRFQNCVFPRFLVFWTYPLHDALALFCGLLVFFYDRIVPGKFSLRNSEILRVFSYIVTGRFQCASVVYTTNFPHRVIEETRYGCKIPRWLW